jgi:AraC family transcriptional regulator, chitin signaling transcriptional activator
MLKHKYLGYFICCFLVVSINSVGQIKLPPVNNFNIKDYKGGNQNWSIDSADGYIYVGNNEGLLEFDGINWYLHKLPNKTIVRSVKVVGDKIYTGSYEEFGFWKRSNTGNLVYTNLSEGVSFDEVESQTIWEIYEFEGKIIFKSFFKFYIFKNGSLKVLKPNLILMAANVIDGRFIVQGIGKGLLELRGDELILLKNTQEIANYRVQAIIPFSDNQLLIGTSLHGCFIYDNGKLTKWNNSFNNLVQENELNTLIHFNNKIYAGTINNGIYEYDYKNDSYLNLNVKNGLQNNTVLSSTVSNSNLWLALDNGVSTIPIDFYAYYLNPFKEDIGAVYDIVQLNDNIYLATNTGLYRVDSKGITFIEGSQGHTWSLTLVDDHIICGHNSGTYKIVNDQLSLISLRNGGYIFKRIPEKVHEYIQGNYSGLTFFKKQSDTWESRDVDNFNFATKNIVFEKPHVAWVSHASKGVFKIYFSETYDKVLKIEEKYNENFSNVYNIKLFKVDGNIAFYCEGEWQVYNSIEDKIEKFEPLNNILGDNKNSVVLNKFSDKFVVFKKSDNSIFIRSDLQDSHSQIYVPKKYYDTKLVRGEGEQKAVIVNDSLVFIALYNNVLVVNTNKINKSMSVKMPSISRIYKNGILQKLNSELDIRQRDTLQIELNTPYLSNNTIEYSLGNKHWINSDGKIQLTGLPYGTVNLAIRSLLNVDEFSAVNTIKLNVRYPWYMRFWGVLLAIVITTLILVFITTINKYVLIKHKRYLNEQYDHEQEIFKKEEALKNEIKVNELQKRQHEIELNAKTKELANTAMEMTKKDELLELIKTELLYFKNEIINKRKFEKLITTLNKNINTSKDWEVFESNFNNIHDSFFKILIKKHSNLTPKDLKLCAYLKMNLATKEIAPIMAISVRGVELHRYRLRKKINLDKNQNLNEYFMNIS